VKTKPKTRHSIKLQVLAAGIGILTLCVGSFCLLSGCSLGDLDLHARELSIGDKDSSRKAIVPIAEKAVLP
jgi:hypothetical protein